MGLRSIQSQPLIDMLLQKGDRGEFEQQKHQQDDVNGNKSKKEEFALFSGPKKHFSDVFRFEEVELAPTSSST